VAAAAEVLAPTQPFMYIEPFILNPSSQPMFDDGDNESRWCNLLSLNAPGTTAQSTATAATITEAAATAAAEAATASAASAAANTTTTSTTSSAAARRGPNLVYWLRGIPFQAQRSDVEAFLAGIDFSKLDIGVLENGECSGNAFVELKGSKHQAELERLHNAFIAINAHAALDAEVRPKPRFVEVMPSNPAKRLEQLEHDRCLPRDATRRQRRLHSTSDNVDGDPFNQQYGVVPRVPPPPLPPPMRSTAMPNFTHVCAAPSGPFGPSIGATLPQLSLAPQQPAPYYVPYGVQMTAGAAPSTVAATCLPPFQNYAATTGTTNNMSAILPFAPQMIGEVMTTAGGVPHGYSISYDFAGPAHPTPFYGHSVSVQPRPSEQQQQQQQQQQAIMPTIMIATPYGAGPFTLSPPFN
jgi:hypothetical protein